MGCCMVGVPVHPSRLLDVFPRGLDFHRRHALWADEVHRGGCQRQHHQSELRGERGGYWHSSLGHDFQPGKSDPQWRY